MHTISILLILAAVYCGAVWLFTTVQVLSGRIVASTEIENHTFHLGLCFILCLGFLGLIGG